MNLFVAVLTDCYQVSRVVGTTFRPRNLVVNMKYLRVLTCLYLTLVIVPS